MIDTIKDFLYAFLITFFAFLLFGGLLIGMVWLIVTFTSGWGTAIAICAALAILLGILAGLLHLT
jgi:hypothetical protein